MEEVITCGVLEMGGDTIKALLIFGRVNWDEGKWLSLFILFGR
jgi:hypothetical protein